MFANQQALQLPQLKEHASALGLDMAKFSECLDSGKHAAAVTMDLEYGNKLGVRRRRRSTSTAAPVVGAQPFEYFKSVIDEELARK